MAKKSLYRKIGKKTDQEKLQELVINMREKGFYIPKEEERKIDWSAYTTNQINDIIDTLHFIKEEVDKIHKPRKHNSVGRPPVDPGALAKAILFVELFGFPERKAEGWITLLGHHLGIEEHIDDRVLGKAYKKREIVAILNRVFVNNISNDGEMGGDGTGLEQSRKQNYESTKEKGRYMTSIVDSREIVQAFDLSGEQECRAMHHLIREVAEALKNDVNKLLKKANVTLDAGFVDRKLAQLIVNSDMVPFIFPKTNTQLKSDGFPGWKKMLLRLMNNVQAWLREYHIRSHTESFHSSLKRIFGIVKKRLDDTIYTQVLCRIIHNNRRKTAYFKMVQL